MTGAHLAAAVLALVLRQSASAPPQPEPESPAAAVNPIQVTPPPSSTGDQPHQPGTPATTGTAPAPAPTPPPPPFTPPAPRITFTVPFPAERGGGEATGTAGSLEYQREDFAVLTGGVTLHYKDLDVRAEEVSVDLTTKQLTALGNVVIDQGPTRLTGTTANFDLDKKTGSFKQGTGSAPPGIYFSGDRIDKVGDIDYVIDNGVFTSCTGESPPWSFHVNHTRLRLDDYAHIRGASMRVHSVPVMYVPYMIWPTKIDRASGLLFPKLGNSQLRGTYLGLAYYQVLGRSVDDTVFADLYSKGYNGFGDELRYRPTEGTSGVLRGYAIQDPKEKKWRWKGSFDHQTTDLPLGLRALAHLEDYSDFNFFQDFERGLNTSTQRSIYSDATVSGSWGTRYFNLLFDRRQTFLQPTDNSVIVELEQLPRLDFSIRPTRIGTTSLYYIVDSTASYLSQDRGPGQLDGRYGRFHLAPQLRAALSPTTWLSLTINGGEDFTYYGDSVGRTQGPLGQQQTFTGQSLTRTLPFAGAELIGPSFSRIFDVSIGPFAKFKHIIEPRFDYNYESTFQDQLECNQGLRTDHCVPLFDSIDQAGGQKIGEFTLANRILAKPSDPTKGSAREILSLEISRRYSFDPAVFLERGATNPLDVTTRQHAQLGPISASLRANPTERLGLRVDADYSTLFKHIEDVQISGNVAFGRQLVSFTWFPSWLAPTGERLANQAQLGGTLHLGEHLTISSYLTYDFHNLRQNGTYDGLLRNERHLITWAGSCYAFHLEFQQQKGLFQGALATRRDYLFSIDLKNVGTFIDMNGGETTGL